MSGEWREDNAETPRKGRGGRRTQRKARTTLFVARGPAAFGNQLVNERGAWLYMLADKPLSALKIAFQGRNTLPVLLNARAHFFGNYGSRTALYLLALGRAQFPNYFVHLHGDA